MGQEKRNLKAFEHFRIWFKANLFHLANVINEFPDTHNFQLLQDSASSIFGGEEPSVVDLWFPKSCHSLKTSTFTANARAQENKSGDGCCSSSGLNVFSLKQRLQTTTGEGVQKQTRRNRRADRQTDRRGKPKSQRKRLPHLKNDEATWNKLIMAPFFICLSRKEYSSGSYRELRLTYDRWSLLRLQRLDNIYNLNGVCCLDPHFIEERLLVEIVVKKFFSSFLQMIITDTPATRYHRCRSPMPPSTCFFFFFFYRLIDIIDNSETSWFRWFGKGTGFSSLAPKTPGTVLSYWKTEEDCSRQSLLRHNLNFRIKDNEKFVCVC